MTEINIALLDEALDKITAQPENWNQSTFLGEKGPGALDQLEVGSEVDVCHTEMCLAGWAMLCSGQWKPVVQPWKTGKVDTDLKTLEFVNAAGQSPRDVTDEIIERYSHLREEELTAAQRADEHAIGVLGSYGYVAMGMLGLDLEQATALFMHMTGFDPEEFAANVRSYLSHVEG